MPKDRNIIRCPSCGTIHPDYDGTDYCESCEPPPELLYARGGHPREKVNYDPTETDRMTDA